jgi:hypothetical protein
MKMRITLVAGISAVALALSACGSKDESGPVENTDTSNLYVNDTPMAEPSVVNEVAPLPAPTEAANATATVDTPPPAPDAQMQYDAEATGMTSRANRDGDAPAGNQEAPAE